MSGGCLPLSDAAADSLFGLYPVVHNIPRYVSRCERSLRCRWLMEAAVYGRIRRMAVHHGDHRCSEPGSDEPGVPTITARRSTIVDVLYKFQDATWGHAGRSDPVQVPDLAHSQRWSQVSDLNSFLGIDIGAAADGLC